MNRREFLLGAFVAAAAGSLKLYALAAKNLTFEHTFYDLPSAKWPSTHAPLKIAMAADLHVGCLSMPLENVDLVVAELNSLNADIIILPGDFVVSDEKYLHFQKIVAPEAIAERLGGLRAKYGVYATLGNHEWYDEHVGLALWSALEKNNIHVLENDAVKIIRPDLPGQDFWLAGLADDTTRKPDLTAVYNKISGIDPVVMMCHDPGTFHDIDERPVFTGCGHTHGGQLRFWGRQHLQKLPSRAPWEWAYGHIVDTKHGADKPRDLIVTSGVGTSGPPIRLNCPAEIVSITLSSALKP